MRRSALSELCEKCVKTLAVMENMQIISWYNYKHGIRPRQQMCLVSENEKYERDR